MSIHVDGFATYWPEYCVFVLLKFTTSYNYRITMLTLSSVVKVNRKLTCESHVAVSVTNKRGLCAVLESAGQEPSSLSTVWCSTSENMSLWIFWGWCRKCARTVYPWFRPRWRRLTCRHLPEASAVWQQATRGCHVSGYPVSRARLFLPCTGTVRVHPSMCPADVAEEEAAAVHDLWCHLWERQQDIKMPLHPRECDGSAAPADFSL